MNSSTILGLVFFCLIVILFTACWSSPTANKTDEELYEKTITTDNPNKTKIKPGNKVTLYYCLKNGDKVVMSSDQAIEPSVITIPNIDSLSKFERPLLWLGIGDSCVATIDASEAVAELSSYQEHFKKGDKATFIYKILKIE